MGFSRHEYWSELPFPTPGGLPNDPGIELTSRVSIGRWILYPCATWEALLCLTLALLNLTLKGHCFCLGLFSYV